MCHRSRGGENRVKTDLRLACRTVFVRYFPLDGRLLSASAPAGMSVAPGTAAPASRLPGPGILDLFPDHPCHRRSHYNSNYQICHYLPHFLFKRLSGFYRKPSVSSAVVPMILHFGVLVNDFEIHYHSKHLDADKVSFKKFLTSFHICDMINSQFLRMILLSADCLEFLQFQVQ